jgi:hypothetical protein
MAKNIGLRPGKFGRERNFKPAEHGILKWWLMGVGESAGAVGREFIEIEEIVPTETRGNLVIYRQWIVDPDGCEVTGYWVSGFSRKQVASAGVTSGLVTGVEQAVTSGGEGLSPGKPEHRFRNTNATHFKNALSDKAMRGE